MDKNTLYHVDWANRRALVRVDFNVPMDKAGRITDDSRITASLPTLRYLLRHGASLVLMSHLGRPASAADTGLSLKPVADHLAHLLRQPVSFITSLNQPQDYRQPAGTVALLENTRFHAGETANDSALAAAFSRYGDVFVNDAFGSMHRAHASTTGVADFLPAVAGILVARELQYLSPLLSAPQAPAVAILGGAKISDKISVIHNLLSTMDALLIGGGMANTFFRAMGHETGDSLVEESAVPVARELLQASSSKLHLPVDLHVARAFRGDAARQMVAADAMAPGWMALDIGEATIAHFANRLSGAATVFWNGPMGVTELPPFAAGTVALADCLAGLQDATTIVGGGDSAGAIHKAGMAHAFTHISTGGGACLAYLAGQTLPGMAALNSRDTQVNRRS